MKFKWLNKILSCVLAVSLLPAAPVYAIGTDSDAAVRTSPLAKYFDESRLNPDYVLWLENGKQGVMPPMQDFSYLAKSYARLSAMQNALLPKEYDLRDYGLVEPVPNQGDLGICWAITANSAAAGTLMEQFPQTALSSIHTAWFTYNGPEEEEANWGDEDAFNNGGNDGKAVGTMAAWKGPVSNDRAPLNPDNQAIPDKNLRYEADYHLQDAYYMINGIYFDSNQDRVVANDITKQIVMEAGAVTIQFCSSNDSGAYNPETCAWYNSEENVADHAVLIAGWDDDYPKENFLEGNQPEHDGAWLIRNSWDTDWGDDGYFWLSYEDKTLRSGAAYLLEEADNYEKNYQYDTTGWSFSVATNQEEPTKTKAANIFTAESDEMLEAVSFYTTDANTNYTVSVYTGVGEGQPETGMAYQAVQSGMEPYAGYHTIELDTPIPLKSGEKFSIVVELENPTYESPLAIEWCPMQSEDFVPQYLGNGGESYVFSGNAWEDVAGALGGYYITNVCIKGFTNPLPESKTAVPTVRFSEMEGPLADGTNVELTAGDADAIYYSIDGGEYQQYRAPLEMVFSTEEEHIVSAYAVVDDKQGNTVEKTYTKATAQLTDLAVKSDEGIQHFETDPAKLQADGQTIYLPITADSVQIMAQTQSSVKLDGVALPLNEWSNEISLIPGQTRDVIVEAQGIGKNTTVYRFKIYRSMLDFNYAAETIQFDGDKYTVEDANGNEIRNGDSITHLISDQEKTQVTVKPKDGGQSFPDYITMRPALTGIGVDYVKEQTDTNFSDAYAYSENADMSDKVQCQDGAFIPVEPGKDLYIQRQATDTQFAGTIFHLEVPERPATPTVEAAEITETSVTLKEVEGAMYSYGNGEWQESPVFTGLESGKEYRFKAYIPASGTGFCSEIGTADITTTNSAVNPSDYSFTVNYVDGAGNPIPGGGTVTFDKAGPYSREDIPLPYGYMAVIPAHPGEDWLYPTALEFIDGAWKVTNPVVEIMVEPMAAVNIIFKTPDGKVLEDFGYTKYYDSEGGGIETVTAPEGYEFINGNTYAVEITRAADGKLIADPAEVEFVVKVIDSGEPSEPEGPSKPSEPETPPLPDTETPFIKDENGKNGWEVINEEIGKAEDGGTITVDMNGATVVPGNVFDMLRGKDVTAVFDMGGGITWSVNGKDVTFGNTSDIDFSVKSDTENIPVDVINNITGERYSIQISLAHNGEFGFTAVLSINLGSGNAGQKAALYYYNGGALELMCESEISADGTARLTFSHASDYLIVIGEGKTDESDTSDTTSGGNDGNPSTGVATSLIPLAIAAAFIVAAAKRKMK